jgi:GAF domain-containing protein
MVDQVLIRSAKLGSRMAENEPATPPGTGVLEPELARSLTAERAARSLAEHADEWIERLRAAATEAVTTISLQAVITDALREVADSLGVDAAAVLLASDDGSELIARFAVGLIQEVEIGVHIPAGEGFAGRILASGEPLIVNDLEHFPVWSPTLRNSRLSSLVGVPLIAGGQVQGVMHAGSKQPDRFTMKELVLLETIAYPIAAAIDRVKLFESERALRRSAEITANRLASLQRITSALASARNVTEVCETVVEHATAGSSADDAHAGIWMLRAGGLRRVAGSSGDDPFDEIPLDDSNPVAGHLAGEGPLFVETRDELVQRWPALRATTTRAFAGFPLFVAGRRLGVMAIGYQEDHRFDEHERAYLTAVAEQAGIALERAQVAERAAEEQERQAFLAETSLALTNRYATPEQLLETLVRLAVPRLADRCSVLLERGGQFERVASAQSMPLTAEDLEIVDPVLVKEHVGLVSRVFHGREPVVLGGEGQEPLDPERFGRIAQILAVRSLMIVPLESHLRAVGVMTFAACGDHDLFTPRDLDLALELAARAGRLVEDVTQRQRERALAETLTRALLPARLPHVPGVEMVARYVPAESGPVGGDWYDAFELDGNRLGLVVGDVGGHGVEAASAMARLRNGLFAFAFEGHDAIATLERLSGLLATDSATWNLPDPIVSVFFGTLDLETLMLHTTCAGHPPWLLVRDGETTVQKCGGRVLAGSLPPASFEADHQLQAGDLCLFMTDGLVERPDEDMADSLERLRRAMEAGGISDLEAWADHILAASMPPGGRRDDCCLLAIRIRG